MRLPRVLLMLLRAGAGIQVVLGVAFWTGHWAGLVPIHRTVGVLFVLTLWIIAVLALIARRAPGLAIVASLWGVLVAWLGFVQQQLLVGDMHWIVRVVHLAIGVGSVPIAERLTQPAVQDTV